MFHADSSQTKLEELDAVMVPSPANQPFLLTLALLMYINHRVDFKYSKYTHSEVNKCCFRSQRKQEAADLHPQVEMRRIIANFGSLVLHCC